MVVPQREQAEPAGDARVERLRGLDEAAREHAIGELIARLARPQIARLLRRSDVRPEDADDILATVSLRLLVRLRAAAAPCGEPIERLEEYVTTLTFNTVNDHFRRRFPQRARLKNRLRYLLTRDERMALWSSGDRLVCGLARWRGREGQAIVPVPRTDRIVRPPQSKPADTVVAWLAQCAAPVPFEMLVDAMAELWRVADAPPAIPADQASEPPRAPAEWRQLLMNLWSEIAQLRPMQRQALLLNLRDAETSHALNLFVLTGVASLGELAAALEMTTAALEAIWNELPFDDLRIAAMLQLTRQQVINLRKSARERLTRRMAQKGMP